MFKYFENIVHLDHKLKLFIEAFIRSGICAKENINITVCKEFFSNLCIFFLQNNIDNTMFSPPSKYGTCYSWPA